MENIQGGGKSPAEGSAPPTVIAASPGITTISVPIRTETGASVVRRVQPEKPNHVTDLNEFLKVARRRYLEEAAKRPPSRLQDVHPLDKVIEGMTSHFENDPIVRLRIGPAGSTYVMIRQEREGLVARHYAHIPPDFKRAVTELLEGFPHSITLSPDQFIRPSGI